MLTQLSVAIGDGLDPEGIAALPLLFERHRRASSLVHSIVAKRIAKRRQLGRGVKVVAEARVVELDLTIRAVAMRVMRDERSTVPRAQVSSPSAIGVHRSSAMFGMGLPQVAVQEAGHDVGKVRRPSGELVSNALQPLRILVCIDVPGDRHKSDDDQGC